MRKHIAELKAESREFLLTRYYSFTALLLVYFMLDMIAGIIPGMLFPGTNVISGISMTATSFILNALLGLAEVGLMKAALDSIRGEAVTVRTLFYAFQNRSNRFIIIQLIFTAIKTACSLPQIALNRYSLAHEDMSMTYYYILLFAIMLGALIVTMLATLRLFWANYYLLDDIDLDAGEALRKSLAFTRGRTLEILYLRVSFWGFYLLAYFSMLIGFIYVRPYAEVTFAKYYLKYNSYETAFEV